VFCIVWIVQLDTRIVNRKGGEVVIKRISDFLAGWPMTLVGLVFLVMSFGFSGAGIVLPVDPAWVTIVICGIPLLYLAIWRVIFNKGISKISSALLICIAMVAAILIGDLFAAGEVVFIMEVGALLEEMTTNRAKRGLQKLIGLTPPQARRITGDREERVSADEIVQNDILRILPGELIPADGVIISGETSVDQSVMTGESLPVDKKAGEEVFCGTMNRFGTVDIRVTKTGEDSSLQKMIRIVQEAEKKQAPMQRIADRYASYLVPTALLIAVIAGFVTRDIVRAVTVLVVFCPCALVLATPTAVMAAIGQAAKHGVIIKSGEALEAMGCVKVIAFDKTGTLTCGALEVSDILPSDPAMSRGELLLLTASAESRSEHPLGKAIADCARGKGMALKNVSFFEMQGGKGVSAEVEGGRIYCGNERYIRQYEIPIPGNVLEKLDGLRMQGKASVIVAKDHTCLGIVGLSDRIRPCAKEIMTEMSHMDLETMLLTGDNRLAADYFGKLAGMTCVKAELLPEEKVRCISEVQKDGKKICMVGDGINDAPALKIADVGVAMGSMGSDIAVESADIALMGDDISKILYLKRLSDAAAATIRLSITVSMGINFAAIVCSVLGILNPTTGALVHNAGSCFVVLIAALLYDRKLE